jgi:hypothetical protein
LDVDVDDVVAVSKEDKVLTVSLLPLDIDDDDEEENEK